MYINTEILETTTRRQIKQAHPNISLPRSPTDAQLAPLGYAILHPTPRPEGDVVTQGEPEQGEDGLWYQTWEVRDFTEEELEELRQAAIPDSVTRRQAKQQLVLAGLLDQVQPAIDAIEDDTERTLMQIYWDDSAFFEREHPQLVALGHGLGLSDVEMDDLFIAAAER